MRLKEARPSTCRACISPRSTSSSTMLSISTGYPVRDSAITSDSSGEYPQQALNLVAMTQTRIPETTASWQPLVAACLGAFMLLVDVTIVMVALPQITTDLHMSFTDAQWLFDGYALALAAL